MCDGSAVAGGRRVWLSGRKRWSQRGLPTGGQGEGARARPAHRPAGPGFHKRVLMCSQPKGDRRADEISGLGLTRARTSPKSTVVDCFGELIAHRERDAGSAPRGPTSWFSGIDVLTTTNSQTPASAAAMPRIKAVSNSVMESNSETRGNALRISSQRWHLVFILFQAAWNKGQHSLLNLIHQEGQHHQQGQHHRQVLLAVSVVVFQVIALVLQGVEGLVLDLPAGSSPPHDVPDVVRGQHESR